MSGSIRIEVATVAQAMGLAMRLRGVTVHVVKAAGGYGVEVAPDREENELRVLVLDAVDAWLAAETVDSVAVRIGERSYTVRAASPSRGARMR